MLNVDLTHYIVFSTFCSKFIGLNVTSKKWLNQPVTGALRYNTQRMVRQIKCLKQCCNWCILLNAIGL